jgi:hypothetical protein
MQIHVRLGNHEDIHAIKTLAIERCKVNIPPTRNVSEEEVKRNIESTFSLWAKTTPNIPFLKILILEDKETKTFLGYLLLLLNQIEPATGEKQAFILDGAIVSKYEGKKLWIPLMEKAEEIAREHHHRYIVGMITVTNKTSLLLSQRLGYKIERYQVVKIL